MLIDYGSRDPVFLAKLLTIKSEILNLAEADPENYTAILLQGSGTYGIEATLHTCVHPEKDKYYIINSNTQEFLLSLMGVTERGKLRSCNDPVNDTHTLRTTTMKRCALLM